jgi:hypothetical protein
VEKNLTVKINKNLTLVISKNEVLLIANQKHYGDYGNDSVALKLKKLTAKQLGLALKTKLK